MTYQELLQIVELINTSSRLTELHLKCGDLEVHVRRTPPGSAVPAPPAAAPVPLPPPAVAPAVASPPPEAIMAAGKTYPAGSVLITSPMVGTFYRAPEPGAAPFVQVGQEVEPESIVCIIEVMKLMNSLPAGCKGRVLHIEATDGTPVQFGQVLLVITPC